MLIQLPNGSPDQLGSRNAENCDDAFEAGLRRDLATAPIVSYDTVLGGWPKRAVELFFAVFTLPLWLPALLAAAAWGKLRNRGARVFRSYDCIGYGGRHFACYALRLAPPVSNDLEEGDGHAPANDWSAMTGQAENRRSKWRRAFERLPQMYNVIVGDMALVGPSPLGREQLEPLKTARRYYLSARPGLVGVDPIAENGDASQYKIYALSWSFSTDALLLWDALRSLRNRGELWKPSLKLRGRTTSSGIVVRRRSGS